MMITKRLCTVLGRVLLSTAFIILFIFGLELIRFNFDVDKGSKVILEHFGSMVIVFFITLLSFFMTNEWMRVKNKLHKPFPYFLWILVIPILTSIIVVPISNYFLEGKTNFIPSLNILIESNIIMIGSIMLFFGIIHYLKYNYKSKKSYSKKNILHSTITLKKLLLYTLGLSIVYSVIIYTAMYQYIGLELIEMLFLFFENYIIGLTVWYLVRYINKFLEQKISFLSLLIVTVIGIVVIMQFIFPMLYMTRMLIAYGYDAFIKSLDFSLYDNITIHIYESIYVIFCTLFYQFLYFNKTRTIEQKAFKAEIGKQTEKYESLRRQLSPHFLFNNINVLTALIEENPEKAVHFSESLGNIYRHFLRQENEDVVSLKSALAFSKNYLELLKYRYEEAFNYVLPDTVDSNQYIIPLALQQVIENTIKHNEVSKEMPLTVVIGIQDDYLIVQNTKQLKTNTEMTKKTGIENIKMRYAFLTEKEVIIENLTTSFTVKLPLLNMENS